MAETGATPQRRKLGIVPGVRIGLDDPPAHWDFQEPLSGFAVLVGPSEGADIVVAFFRTAEELPRRLPGLGGRIFPFGALWAAWPRRAAGHPSDITDTVIREHARALGLVDTKVAALDDDWSALKFVWRLESRTRR
jgi:hypothetical protein